MQAIWTVVSVVTISFSGDAILYVSGLASLIKTLAQDLEPTQIYSILRRPASSLGRQSRWANGE